jgi:hypothetical protein
MQEGAPPTTSGVQLVLNDKGRLDVSGKLGSAVDKVEGTLIAQNSDSYTLAVSQVYQLGGTSSKWSGEQVTILKDGTIGYQVRRFNQTRTIVLAVALTGAAVALLASLGLKGSGTGDLTRNSGAQTGQTH